MCQAILTILLALPPLTPVSPDDDPDDVQAPPVEDHFFCCDSVGSSGSSGEGCVKTTEELSDTCSKVLFCPGAWTRDEGTVRCSEGKS